MENANIVSIEVRNKIRNITRNNAANIAKDLSIVFYEVFADLFKETMIDWRNNKISKLSEIPFAFKGKFAEIKIDEQIHNYPLLNKRVKLYLNDVCKDGLCNENISVSENNDKTLKELEICVLEISRHVCLNMVNEIMENVLNQIRNLSFQTLCAMGPPGFVLIAAVARVTSTSPPLIPSNDISFVRYSFYQNVDNFIFPQVFKNCINDNKIEEIIAADDISKKLYEIFLNDEFLNKLTDDMLACLEPLFKKYEENERRGNQYES